MYLCQISSMENFFVVLKEISFVQCFINSPSAQVVENTETGPSAGCGRDGSF